MEINHLIEFVDGPFDTETGELVCVGNKKYNSVSLCFKANMFIPFAKIKLHTADRFVDGRQVFEDAEALGAEIAKRWNAYKKP